MKKRGQFTLFAILGVVIIVIIGVGWYFRGDISEFTGIGSSLSYPSEVAEIVEGVQDCVDASAYEAVLSIGYTGGYYLVPDDSFFDDELGVAVPYFYNDGVDATISLDALQDEVSTYVSALVDACVYFDAYSDFSINAGEAVAESIVNRNSVDITVEYPFEASVGENSYTVDESYEVSIAANLGWLRDVAAAIVAYDVDNDGEINYDFLLEQGVASIVIAPFNDDTFLYMLEDTTSFEGAQNYTFMFAEYYSDLEYVPECEEDFDCDENYSCEEEVCVAVEEEE
jgi:hypothetical protein